MDRVRIETLDPRLGLDETMSMVVLNAPANYWESMGRNPSDLIIRQPAYGRLDFIHLFATNRKTLEGQLSQWVFMMKPAGLIWVSWPRESSAIENDLNEQVVQEIALGLNLAEDKLCLYDENWFAMKLVNHKKIKKISGNN